MVSCCCSVVAIGDVLVLIALLLLILPWFFVLVLLEHFVVVVVVIRFIFLWNAKVVCSTSFCQVLSVSLSCGWGLCCVVKFDKSDIPILPKKGESLSFVHPAPATKTICQREALKPQF